MRDGVDELAQASPGLPQRRGACEDALDESTSALALGSVARLARDDRRSDGTLGDIVRGFDPLDTDEGPDRWLGLEDPAAHPGRLVPDASRTFIEQSNHAHSDVPCPALQSRSVDVFALVHVPDPEQCAEQPVQSFPDPTQILFPFRHPAEVADQMSEADLALLQVDVGIARVAIGDGDPVRVVADQFARHHAAARTANEEDRRVIAYTRPEPSRLVQFRPRRLIEVLHVRFGDRRHRVRVGLGEPLADPCLDPGESAKRDVDAEGVGNEALCVAATCGSRLSAWR